MSRDRSNHCVVNSSTAFIQSASPGHLLHPINKPEDTNTHLNRLLTLAPSDSTPDKQEREINLSCSYIACRTYYGNNYARRDRMDNITASRRHPARALLPKASETLSRLRTGSSNPSRVVLIVKAAQAAHGPFYKPMNFSGLQASPLL